MTVITTASNPSFSGWTLIAQMTYTIDTLTDLNAQYPDADFFITGADTGAILSGKTSRSCGRWRAVGVTRPATCCPTSAAGQHFADGDPAMAISSTECRQRVRTANRCGTRPDGVVQYIAKHRLYRPGEQTHNSSTR